MKSNKINLNLFIKKINYHVQFAATAFGQRLLCFSMLQIIMACEKKIETQVEYKTYRISLNNVLPYIMSSLE